MNTVKKIDPKEFGLEEVKANELTSGLTIIKEEKERLKVEFSNVSKLEITHENIPVFKSLRSKIRDNRTKKLEKWKTAQKAYFLAGGNFVQAIYNKEVLENKQMEDFLLNGEKHFENLEKERIEKLQKERVDLLSEFVEDASERDLSSMASDVWDSFLATKKKSYFNKIELERKEEEERQAKIQAEKEEQERIRKENEKLKAEAKERERLAKIESDKRLAIEKERLLKEELERKKRQEQEEIKRKEYEAKIQAEKQAREKSELEERLKREAVEKELKAKLDAEIEAKKQEHERIQRELNKGDEDKINDLLNDLEALKNKYNFDSDKNNKMKEGFIALIDKVKTFVSN